MCTWKLKYNIVIATIFEGKLSARLSSWPKRVRDNDTLGHWLFPNVFEDLRQYWNTDEFKVVFEQAIKARNSLKGGLLHNRGAKSVGTITREMVSFRNFNF